MLIKPSERLTYRLMDMSDADLLFELDQDPKVMEFINKGKPSSMEDIQNSLLPRLKSYLNPDKGWGIWEVRISKTNEYIGWVLTRPMDFFSDAPQLDNIELGWRFKSHCWGQGYATESAKHAMEQLAIKTNIKRFCAIAVPENKGSIKVMERLGMHYIKTYTVSDPLFTAEVVYYECNV